MLAQFFLRGFKMDWRGTHPGVGAGDSLDESLQNGHILHFSEEKELEEDLEKTRLSNLSKEEIHVGSHCNGFLHPTLNLNIHQTANQSSVCQSIHLSINPSVNHSFNKNHLFTQFLNQLVSQPASYLLTQLAGFSTTKPN